MLALLLFLNERRLSLPVKRRRSLPGTSAAAAAATASLVWNGDLPRLAAIGLSAAAAGLTPQVRHRPISSLHTKENP